PPRGLRRPSSPPNARPLRAAPPRWPRGDGARLARPSARRGRRAPSCRSHARGARARVALAGFGLVALVALTARRAVWLSRQRGATTPLEGAARPTAAPTLPPAAAASSSGAPVPSGDDPEPTISVALGGVLSIIQSEGRHYTRIYSPDEGQRWFF